MNARGEQVVHDFILGMSREEVAKKHGLSVDRVRVLVWEAGYRSQLISAEEWAFLQQRRKWLLFCDHHEPELVGAAGLDQ